MSQQMQRPDLTSCSKVLEAQKVTLTPGSKHGLCWCLARLGTYSMLGRFFFYITDDRFSLLFFTRAGHINMYGTSQRVHTSLL